MSEKEEMLNNSMADARSSAQSTRWDLQRLLDELRACEGIRDDVEMARASVDVLAKIDSAVSDLIAEFKCVKYLRYHSDYLARQES